MAFEIEIRTYADPDVVRMVAEVQAEYVVRYGGPDAAAVDPAEFAPPDGLFLVGLLDGEPVAMGGWRRADAGGEAEIKRMYVPPAPAAAGWPGWCSAELERTAAAAGVARAGAQHRARAARGDRAVRERRLRAGAAGSGTTPCHPTPCSSASRCASG